MKGTWKMNLMVIFVFPVSKKKCMHVSVLWMFAIHYSTIFWGCVYNCIFMVIFVFIKFTVE